LNDCFYWPARNALVSVFMPFTTNDATLNTGYFAYSYNTVNNTIDIAPYKIVNISQDRTNSFGNFPTRLYHNNDLIQKTTTGEVYFSCVPITRVSQNFYEIKTFVFDRSKYGTNLNFNQIPTYNATIPATAPAGSPFNVPMVIRYAKFKTGTIALAYMYARSSGNTSIGSDLGALSDLYITFNNNGIWSSPVSIVLKIPFNGGSTNLSFNGQVLPFTGWSTGYDMYYHPLENTLHILYITDIQSAYNKPVNSIASNCKIRLMKLNSSGTILSDVLVFDAGAGASVINGFVYGAAQFINYFYKSTNSNEFIPYFSVTTNNGSTSTHRIFKYINGAYSQIYSVPWSPMGTNSGPNGVQVKVITT
jgi:hypothetical protein